MKRLLPVLLVPFLLAARPSEAAPTGGGSLENIQVTYHGGPLLQHVRVITLFWGSGWESSSLRGYFNSFFRTLFVDGRFMANLAQYSAGGYQIGNGGFGGSTTDDQDPPAQVQDAQIQTEIHAQIAAGHLRKPTSDTVYFVFMPPNVEVIDGNGDNSEQDFAGYHDHASGSDGFAYAVIPFDQNLPDPGLMTVVASHELAESITDPEPNDSGLAWYDDQNGEIGDIVVSLFTAGQIDSSGLLDELDGSDGTRYLVQKQWSNQANAPVAFADPSSP